MTNLLLSRDNLDRINETEKYNAEDKFEKDNIYDNKMKGYADRSHTSIVSYVIRTIKSFTSPAEAHINRAVTSNAKEILNNHTSSRLPSEPSENGSIVLNEALIEQIDNKTPIPPATDYSKTLDSPTNEYDYSWIPNDSDTET